MCVELLTPDGNWSSYPPHKHDDSPECPVNNEEIYYFRIAPAAGFGLHRLYTSDGQIDETVEVRDGDVFLIPRGYHGPCVAAPGYTMYYLNVLAGSGPGRSMAFCDDPAHHWVRDSWEGMATDPRCPMTSAGGVVAWLRPSCSTSTGSSRPTCWCSWASGRRPARPGWSDRRQRTWPEPTASSPEAPAGTARGWTVPAGEGPVAVGHRLRQRRRGRGHGERDGGVRRSGGADGVHRRARRRPAVGRRQVPGREPGAAAVRERRLLRGLPQRGTGREHARARRVRPHRPPGGPGGGRPRHGGHGLRPVPAARPTSSWSPSTSCWPGPTSSPCMPH